MNVTTQKSLDLNQMQTSTVTRVTRRSKHIKNEFKIVLGNQLENDKV